MKTYRVELTGLSALLHHRDDVEWSDRMREWREIPKNKSLSKAGDDRSPGFSWLGSLYHDGQRATIPADNLMRSLMEGGAQVLVPGGRSGKTFKAQTQSGMLVAEEHWPLLVGGKPVDVRPLLAMTDVVEFGAHAEAARKAGFVLYVKRAKIGASKHVRVRPRFDAWSCTGMLSVWDEQLTLSVLRDILRIAGAYKGIGDWRPSGRTPGPFGRFEAEIQED